MKVDDKDDDEEEDDVEEEGEEWEVEEEAVEEPSIERGVDDFDDEVDLENENNDPMLKLEDEADDEEEPVCDDIACCKERNS